MASTDFYSPRTVRHPARSRFVFATGIECSTPVIAGPTHLRYGPFSIIRGMV
ncbi:MAG: hypothetical protein ACK5SX_02195 [Sandaracinobacter sp.]